MVFEDMQWADDSLLDFIDYLLEWSRAHPIFVCTLARPEIHERRPTWGAAQRSFTSLYLEPLAQPAMEQLLDGLVPGLPEELRAQILERAEGVPLYAVETVRMMLDRGALVQDGPVYRPVGPIASLEVPETLHALIAARLDGLESEERRVLQDAAVLGKSFTRQALATLAGLDDAELEPLLRALTRKEILSVQADPRSPEHGQYSFVQDLLRHVAYETLSKHDRRMRHLAAARHLESAFVDEDEIVEVVASHYLEAFRSAPDASDSAEIKIKAREMLTRAGDRAASLGAAREGQRYFEQAAELADDAVTCADLQDRAGQMAWRRGRAEEARKLLDQAHGTFEQARQAKRAAAVSGRLADIDFIEGHPGDAVERLERALGTLSGPDADDEAARATAQLGRVLVLLGQTEEAAPHLERALTLAEGLGLDETFAQALNSKSLTLLRKSRFREARILLEAAIATAEEADLPSAAARALNNLAVVNESTDRYVDALATTDRAGELLQRTGDRVAQKALWAGSISTLVLLGRWDEALERFAEVQSGELGTVGDEGQHLWIVQIACWRGDLVEAKRQMEGLPDPETFDNPQVRTTVLVHFAMLERMDGNPRAALERIDRALPQSLDELGISFLTVKLMIVEALEAAFALGDRAKAEELLALIERFRPGERPPLLNAHAARFRALLAAPEPAAERDFASAAQIFDDHGLVFWLAVTQLEHAEWLVGQDREAEAERLSTRRVRRSSGSRRLHGSSASRLLRARSERKSPPSFRARTPRRSPGPCRSARGAQEGSHPRRRSPRSAPTARARSRRRLRAVRGGARAARPASSSNPRGSRGAGGRSLVEVVLARRQLREQRLDPRRMSASSWPKSSRYDRRALWMIFSSSSVSSIVCMGGLSPRGRLVAAADPGPERDELQALAAGDRHPGRGGSTRTNRPGFSWTSSPSIRIAPPPRTTK